MNLDLLTSEAMPLAALELDTWVSFLASIRGSIGRLTGREFPNRKFSRHEDAALVSVEQVRGYDCRAFIFLSPVYLPCLIVR